MRVSGGNKKPKYIECVDHKRNIWKIRWDFKKDESIYSFEEKILNHKPSLDEIKKLIYDWYNKLTDIAILSGFTWRDMPVWLSAENQFNYKAAYDLAILTNGASLPVKFKFGTTDDPVYYNFELLEDLTDFYISAMRYINTVLDQGWNLKDTINWNKYND